MKKLIMIGMASMLLVTGCGCNKKEEEGKKDNNVPVEEGPTVENPAVITNEDMIKDQEVEGLQFTNTGLIYDGNMTTLTSQVTNTTDEKVELARVKAYITYITDFGAEKVLEMDVYFGESLEAGETRSVLSTVDVDLRQSSKIEYQIVR